MDANVSWLNHSPRLAAAIDETPQAFGQVLGHRSSSRNGHVDLSSKGQGCSLNPNGPNVVDKFASKLVVAWSEEIEEEYFPTTAVRLKEERLLNEETPAERGLASQQLEALHRRLKSRHKEEIYTLVALALNGGVKDTKEDEISRVLWSLLLAYLCVLSFL